jgi:glycerophosphoryl diester phosphodiesterase
MKIISHRGAAGLAPENSLLGIEIASNFEVEYIEVDVLATRDGKLILLHDETFETKNGRELKINDSTLAEIRKNMNAGQKIPTLEDAFKTAGKVPLLIDCKGGNWVPLLVKALNKFKGSKPIVACDDSRQLFAFMEQVPDADCFLSEIINPLETVQTAKALNFSGICMYYSIYNPLVYFLAKRAGLRMTMFTVNRPAYAWFLHFFYPEVLITTDFPNRFAKERKVKKLMSRKRPKKRK